MVAIKNQNSTPSKQAEVNYGKFQFYQKYHENRT